MRDIMLLSVLRMPIDLWNNTPLDSIQRHGRYKEAADRIEALKRESDQMRDVLTELIERNNLRGDLDMYLYNLCRWGMGKVSEKPNHDDFGMSEGLCTTCCWLKDGACLKGADYDPPVGVVACGGFVEIEELSQEEE